MLEGVKRHSNAWQGCYGAPQKIGRVLGEHFSTWEGCYGAPLVIGKGVS